MTVPQETETFATTHNDFRSDTFTVPTASMTQQLVNAFNEPEFALGDSVYQEDATTLQLEQYMCELTGKPAALFCSSGTMSNQIGLRANLMQPPYSILCDYRSHVFLHEAGGLATLSQAMVHPVIPSNGNYLTLEDVVENFTSDEGDIHAAPTKVISLENTLHGIVMPIEEIRRISEFAHAHQIKLHLDGARVWNAHIATKVPMAEICRWFDSVSLCLSKSLGAPVGSVLVGGTEFIAKANHFKKQCGGGIRQSGIVCHMAMTAIRENLSKLEYSHRLARSVGDFCKEHGIALESPVDSSFVFLDLKKMKMNDGKLVELGNKYGVKLMGGRIAFHFQLSEASVDNVKQAIYECYQDSLVNPYEGNRCSKKLYNFEAIKIRQSHHY